MKKVRAIILILVALLAAAECFLLFMPKLNDIMQHIAGSDLDSNMPAGDTNPQGSGGTATYEITEEAVRNHPVAPESDFTYRAEYGGITIIGYKGTDSIVVIPEEINGSPVRSIFRGAFDNGSTAKGLFIPSNIHILDTAAFMNNQVLEVVVWDNAQQIGSDAFCGCSNLRLLVLDGNTILVGVYAFYGCFDLTIKVVPGSYMETYCKDHNLAYTTE